MAYVLIPVQPRPHQTASVVLDDHNVRITLRTTDYGLFADLLCDGRPVIAGRLCLDRTDINPARYLGLPQFLGFVDLRGDSPPHYAEFGTRFLLIYGDPADNGGTVVPGATDSSARFYA